MTGAAATSELTASAQQNSDPTSRPVTNAEAATLLEGDLMLLQRLVKMGCAASLADNIRCTLLALITPSGAGLRGSSYVQTVRSPHISTNVWRGSRRS